MAFDYSKLRGRMVEKYGSVSGFSAAIGKAPQTVTAKLNSGRSITRKDITSWSEALSIETDEIGIYFFTPKV